MSFNDYYAAIDLIEDLLRKDLIGPVEPEETLSEAPLGVYSMGILWAQKTVTDKTKVYEGVEEAAVEQMALELSEYNTDIDAVDDLDNILENTNGQLNAANLYRPSAMALTMVISGQEESLVVRFNCASYSHHEEEV